MKTYLECWTSVAAALFSQALAGEPQLAESLPKPLAEGAFGFAATLSGDREGRFAVILDGSILESPLVGEGVDQKAGWGELLREVADAAAGELLAKSGVKCRVEKFEPRLRGEQGILRLPVAVGRARLDDSGSGRGALPQAGAAIQDQGSLRTNPPQPPLRLRRPPAPQSPRIPRQP